MLSTIGVVVRIDIAEGMELNTTGASNCLSQNSCIWRRVQTTESLAEARTGEGEGRRGGSGRRGSGRRGLSENCYYYSYCYGYCHRYCYSYCYFYYYYY